MNKYRVYVEEIYSGHVEIEAGSAQEAEDIARNMSCSGEIDPARDFDGNTYFFANEEAENA